MRWLITGGCGFIGTNLISDLIRQGGHSIRVVDNLSTGSRCDLEAVCEYVEVKHDELSELKPGIVELVVGDVLDADLALSVSKCVDVIVHLAANTGVGPSVENPRMDCVVNVMGTLNYLEACRVLNIPKFIFASSGAPAGKVNPPIHEEVPPHPVSPYGASKLAGEGYCSAYKLSFDVDTIALRFGNVYGPGSIHKESVVAKFIKKALMGDVLEIFGDGSQTRDFIYIDDLIGAVVLAANSRAVGGEIFQIASSRETTINEMVDELIRALKAKNIENIQIKNSQVRIGDVKRNYSDTSKASSILDWRPKTSLYDGLSKTVDYFLENRDEL